MELINANNHLSLEFDYEELDKIREAILSIYSNVSNTKGVSHETIVINGQNFILVDDYGDSALISTSSEGDEILNRVFSLIK
ncbi:MAG: hypothetical protein V4564_17870 [Pseudomonadota bacterium]